MAKTNKKTNTSSSPTNPVVKKSKKYIARPIEGERKRGALSTEEKIIIRQMVNDGRSIQDICLRINRNDEPIITYIDKNNLLLANIDDETAERVNLRNKLMTKHYWEDLKNQLNEKKGEVKTFIENWIDFIIQFGEDITKTEESQIRDMIMVDILIARQMKDANKNLQFVETLEKEYEAEVKKEIKNDARIMELEGLISMVRATLGEFNKQYKELLERKSKILNDLKATRDQRVKKIEDSLTTFGSYIKMLEDEDARKRTGEQIELMKVAKDRAKTNLSQLHIFGDGKGDLPLLTAETYESYLVNQENLEQQEIKEQKNENSTNNGN